MNAVSESFAIVESFKTRAEAVSAHVQRVATRQLAIELVIRLLRAEGVDGIAGSRAVCRSFPRRSSSAHWSTSRKPAHPLVLIDCSGCVMQIGGGIDKQSSEIKVEHIAQRLARSLQ